jgi:hypothetical protein
MQPVEHPFEPERNRRDFSDAASRSGKTLMIARFHDPSQISAAKLIRCSQIDEDMFNREPRFWKPFSTVTMFEHANDRCAALVMQFASGKGVQPKDFLDGLCDENRLNLSYEQACNTINMLHLEFPVDDQGKKLGNVKLHDAYLHYEKQQHAGIIAQSTYTFKTGQACLELKEICPRGPLPT